MHLGLTSSLEECNCFHVTGAIVVSTDTQALTLQWSAFLIRKEKCL